MPDPTRSGRHQKALYWAKAGTDDSGEPTFAARVELSVRWLDLHREVVDRAGNPVSTEATVKVDREVPDDSVFWKGGEADIPGTGTGDPETGFYQVVTYSCVPDMRGRRFHREATLRKFRDGPLEYA